MALMDFDRTNQGKVTASQLRRNLPRPPTLTEGQIELVVRRFMEPDGGAGGAGGVGGAGSLVNYYALHRELEGIRVTEPMGRATLPRGPANTDDLLAATNGAAAAAAAAAAEMGVVGRLAAAFFKGRVRPLESFRDYDKLRSSYITPSQFTCGLNLACRGVAEVTRDEMKELISKYAPPHPPHKQNKTPP